MESAENAGLTPEDVRKISFKAVISELSVHATQGVLTKDAGSGDYRIVVLAACPHAAPCSTYPLATPPTTWKYLAFKV